MKSKKIIIISIITIIILTRIVCSTIIENSNIIKEKKIVKEMTEGEYESQITELNNSHEEYSINVQNYKKQIANAITNAGVSTSEDATVETMTTNISGIFAARTSNATATAEDIIEGKTAYVNGELVEGILQKPITTRIYNLGNSSSFDVKSLTGLDDETLSNLTEDNFIVEIISIPASSTADYSKARNYQLDCWRKWLHNI